MIGERYLVSVKERDPGAMTPAITVAVGSGRARRAVTNLEVATLVQFEFTAAGGLDVLHLSLDKNDGRPVQVQRTVRRGLGGVQVWSFKKDLCRAFAP